MNKIFVDIDDLFEDYTPEGDGEPGESYYDKIVKLPGIEVGNVTKKGTVTFIDRQAKCKYASYENGYIRRVIGSWSGDAPYVLNKRINGSFQMVVDPEERFKILYDKILSYREKGGFTGWGSSNFNRPDTTSVISILTDEYGWSDEDAVDIVTQLVDTFSEKQTAEEIAADLNKEFKA